MQGWPRRTARQRLKGGPRGGFFPPRDRGACKEDQKGKERYRHSKKKSAEAAVRNELSNISRVFQTDCWIEDWGPKLDKTPKLAQILGARRWRSRTLVPVALGAATKRRKQITATTPARLRIRVQRGVGGDPKGKTEGTANKPTKSEGTQRISGVAGPERSNTMMDVPQKKTIPRRNQSQEGMDPLHNGEREEMNTKNYRAGSSMEP